MALLDQFGHPLPPVSTSRMTARASRDAGAYRGSISGWRGPQVHSPEGESRERDVMQRRAADLAANDWAAHSAVEPFGRAIGTGRRASIPPTCSAFPPRAPANSANGWNGPLRSGRPKPTFAGNATSSTSRTSASGRC
ncbi:MAG: hypothetical protein ACLTTU_11890 [Bilophila wadsworthia]